MEDARNRAMGLELIDKFQLALRETMYIRICLFAIWIPSGHWHKWKTIMANKSRIQVTVTVTYVQHYGT